jgi:hypothetical protein
VHDCREYTCKQRSRCGQIVRMVFVCAAFGGRKCDTDKPPYSAALELVVSNMYSELCDVVIVDSIICQHILWCRLRLQVHITAVK